MEVTSSTHEQEPAEIIVAAERGEGWAQNWLGVQHLFGTEVTEDLVAAAECFRKAATKGDMDAQSNLGGCYLEGVGVERNPGEAEKWFRTAAEQGQSDGQSHLGYFCETKGDLAQAVSWYRRSAGQGNTRGQNNLAVLLFEGKGVPQNYVEAYKWYTLAAAQGIEKARDGREIVAKEMTRELIAEGQRLAAGFTPTAEALELRIAAPDGRDDQTPETPEPAAMPRLMKTDITNLVERLELFEDRLDVRIEAVYAYSEQIGGNCYVYVNGELHPRGGAQLSQDIIVNVDFLDPAGRVLAATAQGFSSESFYGFETFSLCVNVGGADVSKVRLYPKPG